MRLHKRGESNEIFYFICWARFFPLYQTYGHQQEDQAEFLSSFVEGRYELIGRWPESDSLYAGTVIIYRQGEHLQLKRTVNGQTVIGSARIERANIAETHVLRVYFKINGIGYEGTYLIHSDLDNYARLSSYIYKKGNPSKRPG